MKIETSQLEYLNKRNKNYDKKYGMFFILLNNIPTKIESVLELYGGVGIQTEYIKNKFGNINHTVLEKDENCYKILKHQHPNQEIQLINNLDYKGNNNIDLLVCDAVFNKGNYENIITLLNKYKYKNLIITETGVFNLTFNKTITKNEYYLKLIDKLEKNNIFINKVIYTHNFGMMLANVNKTKNPEISEILESQMDTGWREYLKKIQ